MERDITGRAVQQSAKVVGRVMERVQNKVPLGPGRVKMSRSELRQELSKARGRSMWQFIDMLGDEEVLNILRGN